MVTGGKYEKEGLDWAKSVFDSKMRQYMKLVNANKAPKIFIQPERLNEKTQK